MTHSTYNGKGIAAELSAFDDLLRGLFEATPLFVLITALKSAGAVRQR